MDTETPYSIPLPDFLTGMASSTSLGGNFYEFPIEDASAEADRRALSNDWRIIGFELRHAMPAHAPVADCR
ncbi:MAG: hypothetical protein LBR07_03120 [Puniceicoccales bacterium]|jgi:hypothetical protein|nr:hypothetical protein [Puniceicoccales bacterium]